ncbi:MAG: M23 family metallopeptidase [Cyclobacteriaceae bacterium]|jgi:murein DD-endopeptidase MepM/ murein hydrolase activator NlpD|nr:M23 family metallopeptidase [Cyclobacteriaceae bacterium]
MARIRFRYNPNTLKYERVGIRVGALLFTLFSYVAIGFLFFVGLLLLQNKFLNSDEEKALRAENRALAQHHQQLASTLVRAHRQLDELKSQEQTLASRIFESPASVPAPPAMGMSRDVILMADASEYDRHTEALTGTVRQLLEGARYLNEIHGQQARVGKKEMAEVTALPTGLPLPHFDVTMMVSGYGNRINPFHKGMYHHDGVDLRAPRGTPVLTAGHGVVALVRQSDLVAGFGNYVEIDHGRGLLTRYAHLDEVRVRPGQKVKKGDPLGTVGMSGGSTAPHLHYEVLKDGKNQNPVWYLVEGLTADAYATLVQLSKKENQSFD